MATASAAAGAAAGATPGGARGGERALDIDLLARWRGGERAAGEELCRRHHGTLLGFFATKCRGEAAALATQTLLAIVRDPDGERAGGGEAGRGSFRAHLFALARRELHRHLQLRRRERLDFSIASIEEILAEEILAEETSADARRTSPAPGEDAATAASAPPALSGRGSRAGSSS